MKWLSHPCCTWYGYHNDDHTPLCAFIARLPGLNDLIRNCYAHSCSDAYLAGKEYAVFLTESKNKPLMYVAQADMLALF